MRITFFPLFSFLFYTGISIAAPVPYFTFSTTQDTTRVVPIGTTDFITYEITNNTKSTLYKNGFPYLPKGITQEEVNDPDYCTTPFTLASGASCLAYLKIDGTLLEKNVSGGPVVCNELATPIDCAQPPSKPDNLQLNITLVTTPPDPIILELAIENDDDYCESFSSNEIPNCYIVREIEDSLTITLTNTSNTTTANNVSITSISNDLLSYISVNPNTLSCGDLAPNASCNITFTTSDNLPPQGANGQITFAATNSENSLALSLNLLERGLRLNDVFLKDLSPQSLGFTNLTIQDIEITELEIINVDEVPLPSTCNIPGGVGNTCDPAPTIAATADSHGSGTINATYIYPDLPKRSFVLSTSLSVAQIKDVSINLDEKIIFFYNEDDPIPVLIQNDDPNFNLQATELALDFSGSGIEDNKLSINNIDCPTILPASSSCTVSVINQGLNDTDASKSLQLQMSGDNLENTPARQIIAIAPGLTVAKATDQVHFQYQAFNVINTFEEPLIFDNIEMQTSLPDLLYLCEVNDPDCDGYETSCESGLTLAQNDFCVVWVKALDDLEGVGETSGELELLVTTDKADLEPVQTSSTFAIDHSIALYVAGKFNNVPSLGEGVDHNKVVKWTGGNNWRTVNTSSFNEQEVHSLMVYKGDLYAGGNFSFADGQTIALWNGASWDPAGQIPSPFQNSNGSAPLVTQLYVSTNPTDQSSDVLYAIGLFDTLNIPLTHEKQMRVAVNGMAYWDGFGWHPMPAILGPNNGLTAISDFSTANDPLLCVAITTNEQKNNSFVQCFDRQDHVWENKLGNYSFNSTIRTLQNNGSLLYIGGDFTQTPEATNYVTPYNKQTNLFFSQTTPTTSGSVYTVIPDFTGNYIGGGTFPHAGHCRGGPVSQNVPRLCTSSSVNRVAHLIANRFSSLGGKVPGVQGGKAPVVQTLTVGYENGAPNIIYVGGDFTTAGEITAINGAYWNLATSTWSALPSIGEGENRSIMTSVIGASLVVGDQIPTNKVIQKAKSR